MQHARHRKHELDDWRLELHAVLGCHLVAALHGAHRRRQLATAGVLEALPRRQQGLVADHTQATDFLNMAFGVSDDPVPRNQLRRNIAGVADGDRIGEDVTIYRRIGLCLLYTSPSPRD